VLWVVLFQHSLQHCRSPALPRGFIPAECLGDEDARTTRSTWTLVARPGVDVRARQRASLSDGIARRSLRQSDCVRQYEIVLPELPYRCLLPSAERPSNLGKRTFTNLPLVSCHHRHCCRIRSSLLRFLGSRKFAALAPSHGVLCSIDGPHSSFVAACSLAPYFKI
jgi:hypothetical protein